MFPLPPPPYQPSPLTEVERAELVPAYLRRRTIIERKLADAPPPLLLIRPTAGVEVSDLFKEDFWRTSDIEDKLTRCFFCLEDGWEGIRQASYSRTGTGTRVCLNCFAVFCLLGYALPGGQATVVAADKNVPRRKTPPPRGRPG